MLAFRLTLITTLLTNSRCMDVVTEWQGFNILDKLPCTGLDQLPAWFLWLGAPVFYKPLTCLTCLSPLLLSPISVNLQQCSLLHRSLPRPSMLTSVYFHHSGSQWNLSRKLLYSAHLTPSFPYLQ